MARRLMTVPEIAEPCGESWEQMTGTARVRHCSACGQDVVNLAAMSSADVDLLMAGPLPCLRIVRRADGSVITTEPPLLPIVSRIAAGVVMAAMAVGCSGAQAAMGKMVVRHSVISGQVTTRDGVPLGRVTLMLRQNGRVIHQVEVAADGSYRLDSTPGAYDLVVSGATIVTESRHVQLNDGAELKLPLTVAPAVPAKAHPVVAMVTMGVPALPIPVAVKPVVAPVSLAPKAR